MAGGAPTPGAHWLERVWYGPPGLARLALTPLAALMRAGSTVRRTAYRRGWLAVERSSLPVLVVGNVAVGGTGKTPVVAALVRRARELGLRPGIVSRGYGGTAQRSPVLVTKDCAPATVGDEALMLALDTGVPTVVCIDRPAAVQRIAEQGECDIVLSDDGLQHYRMHRDAEIVVVDGVRQFGNGAILPAGPLREPAGRAGEADLVLVNGGDQPDFTLVPTSLETLDGEPRALDWLKDRQVDAIAGIGHPERFFRTLEELGARVEPHRFDDHHRYTAADFDRLGEHPVVMTAKDAAKCRGLDLSLQALALRVEAVFTPASAGALDELLTRLAGRASSD